MVIPIEYAYIVQTPEIYGNKPRISGHRIAVHDIAQAIGRGYSPAQIVAEIFPTLTLAQVHSALAYYYDHQPEIDREINEEDADIRQRAQADQPPAAQRLRAAIAQRKQQANS